MYGPTAPPGFLSIIFFICLAIYGLKKRKADKIKKEAIEREEELKRKEERRIFDEANPPIEKQLEWLVVRNPGIKLFDGEVCLYKCACTIGVNDIPPETAFIKTRESQIRAILADHDWNRVSGHFYITNRRYLAEAEGAGFRLDYSEIKSIEGFDDGIAICTENKVIPVFIRDMSVLIPLISTLEEM